MPTITVNVDDSLKERMETHPEINWSEVTRQAIEEKLDHLEILDELVGESNLTRDDVDELAQRIDDRAQEQVVEGEGPADR